MFLTINSQKLYFDVQNLQATPDHEGRMHNKRTLIVLHGGPGYDHSPYIECFDLLLPYVQIIYIDMHGHGNSAQGSAKSWNFSRWVSDLKIFIETLGLDKPILFGHSFGSMVAVEFAAKYSGLISQLILCSILPIYDKLSIANFFAKKGGEEAKNAFLNFADHASDPKAKAAYAKYCAPYYGAKPINESYYFYNRLTLRMEMIDYFFTNTIQNYNALELFKLIKVPTLMIIGAEDHLCSHETFKKVASLLGQNCKQACIVKDAGHNALWEQNTELQDIMLQFLLSY